MDHNINKQISPFLYLGLCKKIGFPTEVSIRRVVLDMDEKVRFMADTEFRYMVSGSRREGFDLQTSDYDMMLWWTDQKVICDIRQSEHYRSSGVTLILMECCEDRPGFALPQLITSSYNCYVVSGCFRWNNGNYISSSQFRNAYFQGKCNNPSYYIHGPCTTLHDGKTECEAAACLACAYWPPPAMSWIDRCQRYNWPPSITLQDILYNGVHVVPIGRKNSPMEDHEWRISFSQAEQKLVYSMNHTQFLCYGLLKLFLKEVINVNLDNCPLCSYFMKTVVFWEIQENINQTWVPDNILNHFWQCFKHIIHWVQRGECPNFFIPRYNMFYGKVEGSVQYLLLTKLQDLYSMGMSCLLHCESVRSYLNKAICAPNLFISTDEMYYLQETVIDNVLYFQVYNYVLWVDANKKQPHYNLRCIEIIETLAQSIHCRYQTIVIQRHFSRVLQKLVLYLQKTHTTTNNKQLYDIDKLSCHLLKLAAKFGNISDLLYIAMYYYQTRRYNKAFLYTKLAKYKLSQPYLLWYEEVNSEMYNEAFGSMSLSQKMREAVGDFVRLHNDVCYIDELKLEQKISTSNDVLILHIPPFVMVNMLTVLCNRGDPNKQLEALHDLHALLTNDHNDKYTDDYTRDISWQILGLCYQIYGDVYNALHAYQQSKNQNPFNRIQQASDIRICCLMKSYEDQLHFKDE